MKNTEQNYMGKGGSTILPEQKAALLDDLHVKVNSFLSSVDSQKTIYALNTVLEHWIQTEYKRHVRGGLCDEDMKLLDGVVSNVFHTISLVSDLDKHIDAYYFLESKGK